MRSSASDQGLKCAIDLAKDQHSTLSIVHVIDERAVAPSYYGGRLPPHYFDRVIESMRAAGHELLVKAEALARARGLEVQTHLVEASAQSVAHAIVEKTGEQKADVVVLGTHGRRGLHRLVLGSDAESVLRESAVPVLLVRSEEGAEPRTHTVRQTGP